MAKNRKKTTKITILPL